MASTAGNRAPASLGPRRRARRSFVIAAVTSLAMLGAVGCSTDENATRSASSTTALGPVARQLDAAGLAQLTTEVGDGTCDELDPARCLLPFPSNRFTTADQATPTKLRVHLPSGQIANTSGSPLDVTEWNRNDGFSPGSPMLVSAPNVDLAKSGTATIGDIGASLTTTSSMLIDLTTGKRLLHWVEVDQHAPPGQGLAIVRPAASLPEGHHIGVVLAGLVDSSGAPLEPTLALRAYRDRLTTSIKAIEARRPQMEALFGAASKHGIDRSSVFAAWDFTVASTESLSGRLLAMRDDAFGKIGDGAPVFHLSKVINAADAGADLPTGIGRRVLGTFSVPSYLTGDGGPGSRLDLDPATGLPRSSGATIEANFTCQIPAAALAGPGGTTRPVVYGHGLLGSADEAENSQVAKIASTNDMMYCATDWIGMSAGDVGNAVEILGDLSKFPSLPDRSQQGILDALFLARVMRAKGGFESDPAFATASGTSVINPAEVYYDGNSQGAIMGGAATAVSTEWTKAVLGVPGMNYGLLLSRSVDFERYFQVLRGSYPDPTDQMLIYSLLPMLWDRAESNGYAQHMTDRPYKNTPKHQVVLDVGFGDHQVAEVSAEIEARTIGAAVRGPALAAGRDPDAKPFAGLDVLTTFPTKRSVLVYWDSGTLPPPAQNITPAESEAFVQQCSMLPENDQERSGPCADSHEDPRRAPGSIRQKNEFFRPDGKIIDPCDGAPCTAVHRALLDY